LQQALSEENTAEIDRLHHRFLQELQQLLQQIQQRLQK
jgi:hypothetical protein